jgi:hypothetical protein
MIVEDQFQFSSLPFRIYPFAASQLGIPSTVGRTSFSLSGKNSHSFPAQQDIDKEAEFY